MLLTKKQLERIILEETIRCLSEERLLEEMDLKKLYGKLKRQFPKLKQAAFWAVVAGVLAHPVKYPHATLTEPFADEPKEGAHYFYPQPTEEETPSYYPSGEKIKWLKKNPYEEETDISITVEEDPDISEEEREEIERRIR